MPTYPVSNQSVAGYPSQQFTTGGPLGNAPPPGSYAPTPVPWGPPMPPSYAPYTPPPPGSSMYATAPGQPMPPYGVQYPPQMQTGPPGVPSQTGSSSEAQQSFPPGVQSDNSSSVQSVPTNIYGNSSAPMPLSAQHGYPPSSYGYPSYYSVVPPPPAPVSSGDHSQSMANLPWATNAPPPPPAEKGTYGADAEYEKFMSEMK